MKVKQELMRHANVSVTMDRYVQAVTPAKRKAQSAVAGLLEPMEPNPKLQRLQVIDLVGAIGFEPMTSTV